MGKGQSSLEYLLLLAAIMFFFAAMLPVLREAHALSLFAVDVGKAKAFSQGLQSKATEMSLLADGSRLLVTARPLEKWLVYARGSELLVEVKHDSIGKTKVFTVVFPNELAFGPAAIEGETVFSIRKESGIVLFENK